MPFRNNEKCIFNEEVKENIYNLYRESNLEVLEYLLEIVSWDERIKELYNDYINADFESNEQVNIFWDTIHYISMDDYIAKREREI